jgi:L-alanine-DL-glutamate epimerase-like enolase superfamily enzyme
MRITSVRAYPLMSRIEGLAEAPVSVPRASSTAHLIFAGYRSLLVRIDTDDGRHGVGEGLVRLAPTATAAIVDALAPLLVGRDPRQVDVIWEDLYATMVNRGHTRGFMIEAISAIDIALWDLIGKHHGVPIHQALGGAHANEVPCYASSVRIKPPEEAAADAKALADDGFAAIKLKVGRGPGRLGEDVASVHAVRDAIGPDVQLMVDANGGFDLAGARQLLPELEAADVAWFEEPVMNDDLAAYRALRHRANLPICAGETWFTRYDFRDALLAEAVDIVQPDVSRAGGISETMKIARMASAFNVAFAPHTGQSSAVCLASSLHVAAAASNTLTYEFIAADWSASQTNPLRTALTTFDFEGSRSGATVRIPQDPGIGLEVHWDVVERYLDPA